MRTPFWLAACLALFGCAAIPRSSANGASGSAGSGVSGSDAGDGGGGAGGSASGDAGNGASASASGAVDAATPAASFMIGADITWVQADEASGATYSDGVRRDILSILKDHGFNYIRLRMFVDPTAVDGYDSTHGFADLTHTIAFGKRIKAAGLGFLLDLQYSDNWADPGKQCVPAAWLGFTDIQQMAAALRSYTSNAINKLIAAGARPDMVQIGNEITAGMDIHVCDSDGQPTSRNPIGGQISNWTNLGALLGAGSNAVKAIDPNILVMLHLDRCNDFQTSRNFVVAARGQGVLFDVFGESCYTAYQGQPSAWAATFSQLAAAFPDLKLAIAEYGSEQRAANDALFGLAGDQGLGSFVWEPTHEGAWNTGHALFSANGSLNTASTDLLLYDKMKRDYASRL